MMKKCLFLLLTAVIFTLSGHAQQRSAPVANDFNGLSPNDASTLEMGSPTPGSTDFGPLFEPMGYGKGATGGRGGRIIKVTNLNNSGPGSFRAACRASGPRIVVFEVSGVIELDTIGLTIINDDITIAGQTAPGDGITLVNGPLNDKPTLKIKAKNVIVQYLKIRTGDAMPNSIANNGDINVDAITVTNGGDNVIIDHLSLSWSIDETVQLWSARNVSLQNNIISESLTRSKHPNTRPKSQGGKDQAHGCAILVGQELVQKGNPRRPGGNVSIYQNLMTHNSRRNPRLDCELPVEVINNVIYNSGGAPWGIHQPIVVADDTTVVVDGRARTNNIAGKYDFINNYFKPGPSTGSTVESYVGPPRHFIGDLPDLKNPNTRIYAKGNYLPEGTAELRGSLLSYRVDDPTNDTQVPVVSASDAYNKVLDYVGDCYRLNSDGSRTFRRDELDTRWVNDVKNTTGEWVNVPRDLPPHTKGEVNKDSDDDGMPDEYEDRFGFLNKNDPDDGSEDEDSDGVTNVEEFLFGTSPGEAIANASCNDKPSAGTYQLVARHSGKALAVDLNPDTNGGLNSQDNGVNVFQYGTDLSENRRWKVKPVADGYYQIVSVHSGKALAVDTNPATNGGLNSTYKGVNIFQYGTDLSDNRLWKIEPVGNCYYTLTNKHSSQVLDVSGVSEADGANVQQWSYGEGENQQWKLVPVDNNARVTVASSKSEVNALPQSTFSAYPNPATERLTVQGGKDYQATLYDLSGQRVLRRKHLRGQMQLNISHLHPGVYILKMHDGQQPEVRQRVIIE